MIALQILHWLAAFVVLAEALNQVERAIPCCAGLSCSARAIEWLRATAWALLAIGAACALLGPVMRRSGLSLVAGDYLAVIIPLKPPTFQDACILLGVALLIIRKRIEEG